ncbi:MAG: glycosyltransferase family 4 protein [Actinomycetes bacterium]
MSVPIRPLFVNENMGGHATLHLAIRSVLRDDPEVRAQFLDVPPAGTLRRVAAAPVPGLARADADLQALRVQLGTSAVVRRRLRSWPNPYDVIHVYSQNAGLLVDGILRDRPSVVGTDATTSQGALLLPHRRPARGTDRRVAVSQRFERRVYESATLVVAQSEWAADSLRDEYGVDPTRIRRIPYGTTIPDALPHVTRARPQITFVGFSMERKGGTRLLDLWQRSFRGDADLNLVTRDDVPREPGLRVFRDFRPGDPRLRTLYAETDVLVFPSRIDTFGYALVEAMAAEVPTVALAVAAVPEVVADGETGLLVDPAADDDTLAAAVARILDDPVRARAMGRAGRARALERFDARVTTARLVEVLREARALHGA